ncbi:MAG: LamG domain-containing protein [Verrucomicrobiales bacterium]|nr:LamG domain-containing protein [Verrucomicrobiales bacterium]
MNQTTDPGIALKRGRQRQTTPRSVKGRNPNRRGPVGPGVILLALSLTGFEADPSLAAQPWSEPDNAPSENGPSIPGSLRHRYSFTYDAKDSIGGAHGEMRNGAIIVNGAVESVRPDQYVNLPNDLLVDCTAVTMELWATDRGSGPWARLFDFGNSTAGEDFPWPASPAVGTRYFFLSLPSAYGNLRGGFTVTGGGEGEQIIEWAGGRPPIGEEAHIALTADGDTGVGVLYVNGVEVGRNEHLTLSPAIIGPTANNWLGRSQFIDPTFQGRISEFRIYDTALSAETIAASFATGPDKVADEASLQTSIAMSGNEVVIGLGRAVAGRFYGLETTSDPVGGRWTPLRTVVGNDGWLPLTVASNAAPAFYRARELDVPLVNPGFEADQPTRSPGYAKDNRGVTGWTFKGANEGAFRWGVNPGTFGGVFTDNGAIPEGHRVLFIEEDGTASQHVVGLSPGVAYRLHYFENAQLGASPTCRVEIGGIELVPEHEVVPVDETNPYHEVWSAEFVPAESELDLTFSKHGPAAPPSVLLLDGVQIIPVVP